MYTSKLLLLPLLVAGAQATVTKHNATCTSFLVEVPVDNVTVIVPPMAPFKDQYAATAFTNVFDIRTPSSALPDTTTLTNTFNISAEYCTPVNPGAKASTLQILTHGLGFDRSYWDFYLPSHPRDAQYSYVNAAIGAGYSTFSYDRLGIEPSTLADPYTEIQSTVELALLTGLTTLIRTGSVPHVPQPAKVLHVGHSWGSELTNGLAAVAPELSDGIVLTGFGIPPQGQALFIASSTLRIASVNAPHRFPAEKYSTGFLTWSDKYVNQFNFFGYPNFDAAVLERAEAIKQPFTVSEFLSGGSIPYEAPDFMGPVLYLNGEADQIICASNCTGLYGPDSASIQAFNGSSSVEAYVLPDQGHAINLHHNATGAYDVIMSWAQKHGF